MGRGAADALARRLGAALGGLALRIDHVGSTAVPGLAAKDVIDVQRGRGRARDVWEAWTPHHETVGAWLEQSLG